MITISPKLSLLYLSGNDKIDQLIEKKFQGEDVYVSISANDEYLYLSIAEDLKVPVELKNISLVQLLYNDGLLAIIHNSDEYLFSYNDSISLDLLSFLYKLNVPKEIPEFLEQRYLQMQDTKLFQLIDSLRERIIQHDFIHYYNEIDEFEYSGIIESFAAKAIGEVPLVYIKYIDSYEKENGLLLTYNGIYSPENYISIRNVKSIEIKTELLRFDKMFCYINDELFTTLKVIVRDRDIVSLPFQYAEKFPTDEIFILIEKVCQYLQANSSS